jgi:hypothetical protein
MILEMQFKSDPIKKLVRNAAKAARAVVTDSEANFYVDHIETGVPTLNASTKLSPLAGDSQTQTATIEIHQPVSVMLVQLGDIQATPDFGPVDPSKLQPANVDVMLSCAITLDAGGNPQLCIQSQSATGTNPLGVAVAAKVAAALNYSNCSPIDLSKLASLAQSSASQMLHAAGVAVSLDGTRLALRFELLSQDESPQMGPNDWVSFMAGNFPDRLGPLDWAFFVDAQTMQESVASQMQTAIAAKVDQIDSGPTATWAPNGPTVGTAQEHCEVDARFVDACEGLFGPVDFNFTATLDLTFSVPEPNVLRVDAAIDWHGNKWKEFWCTFSGLVGGAGLQLLSLLDAPGHPWADGIFWLNPLGPVGGLAMVLWAFNSSTVTGLLVNSIGGSFQKIDDTHFRSDTALQLPNDLPVKGLQLTQVSGAADGLVLGGTFDSVIELNDPLLSIKPWSDTGFSWVNPDPCTSDTSQLAAQIYFDESPYFLFMADPIFLTGDDPAGQYAASISQWDQKGISATLTQILPGFAPGYDCKILLLTTGGARYIKITKPQSLQEYSTPQQAQLAALKLIAWRASNCDKASSIWGQLGVFNPHWSVDPGPEQVVAINNNVLNVWSFAISGLAAGEQVTLRDGRGALLGTATAGAVGTISLDALTASAADPALTLSRGGKSLDYGEWLREASALLTRPAATSDVFAMRQVELGLRATVKAGANITSLSIEGIEGHKQLVVLCGDVLMRFDPRSQRLIDRRTFEGLRGVSSNGRRLLAFGEFGIVDVTAQKAFALDRAPVLAATVLGDQVVTASADTLTIYERNFAVRRRMPIGKVTALVSTGRYVAAAVAGGAVEVFERRGDRLDRAGGLAIDCRAGIAGADSFGARAALFVRGSVGGTIIELGNQGRLREAVSYQSEPLWLSSAASGSLLARRGADPTVADIYVVQGSRHIGACRGDCGPACCGLPHHGLRALPLQFRG